MATHFITNDSGNVHQQRNKNNKSNNHIKNNSTYQVHKVKTVYKYRNVPEVMEKIIWNNLI